MNRLYVAWQDATSREWIPVALLERTDSGYTLRYTGGALRAKNFSGLGRMTDFKAVYRSADLFPVFANRVISKSRPEYKDYLRWLDFEPDVRDPFAILSRTGGVRGTDSIELFAPPRVVDGAMDFQFFVRGIGHLPNESAFALERLSAGDQLFLMQDVQNSVDPLALALRTKAPATFVGYCPRYLCRVIHAALAETPSSVSVTVRRVNLDAPSDLRLFCSLKATFDGLRVFEDDDDLRPIG